MNTKILSSVRIIGNMDRCRCTKNCSWVWYTAWYMVQTRQLNLNAAPWPLAQIWGSHCDAAFPVSPNGRLKASAGILVSLYALPTCECYRIGRPLRPHNDFTAKGTICVSTPSSNQGRAPAAIPAGLDAQKSISLGDNLLVAAVRPLYLLANKFCNSTKSWTMYTFDQMSACLKAHMFASPS